MVRLPISFIAAALFALFFMNMVANAEPGQCRRQFESEREETLERQEAKIAWGRQRFEAGDFEAAAWAAESASIMSSTPNVNALLLQAEAYLSLDGHAQALQIIERIFVITAQHNVDALALKVRALYLLGRESETRMALTQVRAIRGFLLPLEIRIEQDLGS